MSIIKQRLGKLLYGGQRVYIEDSKLQELNLIPGSFYSTEVITEENKIVIKPSAFGNKVSQKIKKAKEGEKVSSVIDKSGSDIYQALSKCSSVKITFVKGDETEGEGDRVIIQGIVTTATEIKSTSSKEKRTLTSISFCSGAGLSADCTVRAGFKEIASVEYNPKEGAEDKFANIFSENHKDTIMFNIPMEKLDANDLPYADLWVATLDCTDYSKLSAGKTEFHTMHLYMYLMKLFWQKKKSERPRAIMIENTEMFEKFSGNSLKLTLQEEGFFVTMGKLNSLDFGSRTKRDRFFFVASVYDGYTFPDAEQQIQKPIIDDGIITLENLDWATPETNKYVKYFVERNDNITHGHKMITYDITKDAYVGTIPKSHCNHVPENIIVHPTEDNTYAFLHNIEHLKYLHGIRYDYYLGESDRIAMQSIGQGICSKTFYKIVKKLHDFLYDNMFGNYVKQIEVKTSKSNQLMFAI